MNKIKRKAYGRRALYLLVLYLLSITFAGTAYAASNPIDVAVPITQTFNVTGTDRTDLSGEFAYEMTAVKDGDPLPTGAAKSSKYSFVLDGTVETNLEMQYTHAGEYIYTIKPVVEDEKPGYTYDTEVYTVKVYIRNTSDDLLESEVIVQRSDNNKVAELAFVNAYQPKATASKLMTDPPVQKTVEGSPTTQSKFEFTLTPAKPEFPMPEDSVDGVKTVVITGSGTKEFGVWEYTEAGTYSYEVKETNTGESGYRYDKTVYTIKDIITDVDGQLTLTRTVTNTTGETVEKCLFTNVYSAPLASSGIPKMGDNINIVPWAAMLLVSSLVFSGCCIYILRDRKHKEMDK